SNTSPSQRREIFESIGLDEPRRDVTWIFTDSNKSHFLGCDAISGCENGQATFVRVVLRCGLEENLRRASSAEPQGANSNKLTDASVLRGIRGREEICLTGYEAENELELDVTHLSPSEAAGKIYAHVKILPEPTYP
ncbi:hypothetical protein IMZ48_23405, partial [Candidatus Bathyarchaeota archaeon]|nr:hypothetical protein [Candidatus Bathyarchaeota archaeon]